MLRGLLTTSAFILSIGLIVNSNISIVPSNLSANVIQSNEVLNEKRIEHREKETDLENMSTIIVTLKSIEDQLLQKNRELLQKDRLAQFLQQQQEASERGSIDITEKLQNLTQMTEHYSNLQTNLDLAISKYNTETWNSHCAIEGDCHIIRERMIREMTKTIELDRTMPTRYCNEPQFSRLKSAAMLLSKSIAVKYMCIKYCNIRQEKMEQDMLIQIGHYHRDKLDKLNDFNKQFMCILMLQDDFDGGFCGIRFCSLRKREVWYNVSKQENILEYLKQIHDFIVNEMNVINKKIAKKWQIMKGLEFYERILEGEEREQHELVSLYINEWRVFRGEQERIAQNKQQKIEMHFSDESKLLRDSNEGRGITRIHVDMITKSRAKWTFVRDIKNLYLKPTANEIVRVITQKNENERMKSIALFMQNQQVYYDHTDKKFKRMTYFRL
jgi:hypothetical protein